MVPKSVAGVAGTPISSVADVTKVPDQSMSLPTLGNNAIQFEHNPFPWGGTTLGNVILYGNDFRRGPREDTWFDFGPKPGWGTVGDHERQHTYQGEVLGPLYIPLNLIGMTLGIIQHPTYDLNDLTNGSWNFMEYGPQMNPARPFKN